MMSIALNAALFQDVIFIFILSVIFLKEKIDWMKVVSVILLTVGVVVCAVGTATSSTGKFSFDAKIEGIVLVVLGAILWAIFEVYFKKEIGTRFYNAIDFV
jgi:drug/metabolite transporter (DMT)-like permease